ncbi:hypothetical protein MMC24_001488 [Lignoscripta atroalba]|nr:hypothetical protein [Lignoscripta atroalba]
MKPPLSSRVVIFVACLALPKCLVNGQSCYYPNGDLSTQGDAPCSDEPGSACCPLNWECLSNGLCYLENADYYGRYTCTDQTWQSPGCPNICTQDKTASGNEAILQCSQGYCCDANRPDAPDRPELGCCNTQQTFFPLPDGNPIRFIGSIPPAGPNSSPNSPPSSPNSPTSSPGPSTLSSEQSVPSPSSPDSSPSPATSAQGTSNSPSSPSSPSTPISSAGGSAAASSSPRPTVNGFDLVTSTVTNSAGVTTIITSSVIAASATVAASSPAPSSTSSSRNLGAIIGPAVGVPVVIIALAVIAFLLWRRRKNKQRGTPSTLNDPTFDHEGKGELGPPSIWVSNSPVERQTQPSGYPATAGAVDNFNYRGVPTTGGVPAGGAQYPAGGAQYPPAGVAPTGAPQYPPGGGASAGGAHYPSGNTLYPGGAQYSQSPKQPVSPTRSELSGSSPPQYEPVGQRPNEVVGTNHPPYELPGRFYG